MSRISVIATFLALLAVFAASADAWARAGRSSSMGSRGERTYDRPIERSVTPPPAAQPSVTQPGASQPMYNPGTMRPAAPLGSPMAAQPGFFQRNPFLTGMLGGLAGVGIGSMLFGHSPALAAASEAAPAAGLLGTLFQVALIGGLIWLAVRLFQRRRQTAAGMAGDDLAPASYQREAAPASAPMIASNRVAKEFEIGADDQNSFTTIIQGVQKAWSDGNPVALRALVTPEVAGWMAEDLARDQSRGMRNVMEDVTLLKGDIGESWREGDVEYVTAVITFSARDYMVSLKDGSVVEGDPHRPVEASEAWTFRRAQSGPWVLSAIEQMG